MKRILLVDDDRRGTEPLVIRLRAAGYRVFTATDGVDGLQKAILHRPDLIIMDVWMPNGVGILIAQRLKHFGLGDIPVVFLSASRKQELWNILEEVHPAGFFEKPYDSREVLAAIDSLTRTARVDTNAALVPD